jgi:hypothetical protein
MYSFKIDLHNTYKWNDAILQDKNGIGKDIELPTLNISKLYNMEFILHCKLNKHSGSHVYMTFLSEQLITSIWLMIIFISLLQIIIIIDTYSCIIVSIYSMAYWAAICSGALSSWSLASGLAPASNKVFRTWNHIRA